MRLSLNAFCPAALWQAQRRGGGVHAHPAPAAGHAERRGLQRGAVLPLRLGRQVRPVPRRVAQRGIARRSTAQHGQQLEKLKSGDDLMWWPLALHRRAPLGHSAAGAVAWPPSDTPSPATRRPSLAPAAPPSFALFLNALPDLHTPQPPEVMLKAMEVRAATAPAAAWAQPSCLLAQVSLLACAAPIPSSRKAAHSLPP